MDDDIPYGDAPPASGNEVAPESQEPDAAQAAFEQRWLERRVAVRRAFWQVIRDASPNREQQLDLFEDPADRRTRKAIERRYRELAYEPRVPSGGDREVQMGFRLSRIVNGLRSGEGVQRLPEEFVRRLGALSLAYQSTRGCYYTMQELKSAGGKNVSPLANVRENWAVQRAGAVGRGDEDVAWACGLAAQGIPKPISNFTFDFLYVLRRMDERTFRMVRLRNTHGEQTPPVFCDARAWTSCEALRVWLASQCGGGYDWLEGEGSLHELNADGTAKMAYKFVVETSRWGWQPFDPEATLVRQSGWERTLPGMWVYGDGIVCDSRFLVPDKNGVYWVGPGQGWVIGRKDMLDAKPGEAGQPWSQGIPAIGGPRLDQDQGKKRWLIDQLVARPEDRFGVECVEYRPEATAGPVLPAAAQFASEYVRRMFETLGGMDAHMLVGGVIASALLPEFFAQYSQQHGLWLHGEKGSGKNSVMRWALLLLGRGREEPLMWKSTPAGKEIASSQVCCGLTWLDEYRPGSDADEQLKCNLDRTPRTKWSPGGRREWLSVWAITGQHTCPDAAVVSRYVHIQVSKERRGAVNHVEWFQAHRHLFRLLGREVLLRRAAALAAAREALETWMALPDLCTVDTRSVYVHGLAWCGWVAFARVFGLPVDLAVREHMVRRCRLAEADVKERVDADLVLRDIMSAWQNGAFGETPSEWRRYFTAEPIRHGSPPGCQEQSPELGFPEWTSWRVFVQHHAMYDMLEDYLRRKGRSPALSREDFKRQAGQRDFWVPGRHQKRFGETSTTCWAFDVDAMPDLGYSPVDTLVLRERMVDWLADEAGLDPGDTIMAVNGQDVVSGVLPVGSPIPVPMLVRSASGVERTLLSPGDLAPERWPDARKGPFVSLCEALKPKKS